MLYESFGHLLDIFGVVGIDINRAEVFSEELKVIHINGVVKSGGAITSSSGIFKIFIQGFQFVTKIITCPYAAQQYRIRNNAAVIFYLNIGLKRIFFVHSW